MEFSLMDKEDFVLKSTNWKEKEYSTGTMTIDAVTENGIKVSISEIPTKVYPNGKVVGEKYGLLVEGELKYFK